jgi:hypothetical protein
MVQLAGWMTLADPGLGASPQDHNPLIGAAVRSEWSVPDVASALEIGTLEHLVRSFKLERPASAERELPAGRQMPRPPAMSCVPPVM